MTYLVIGTVMIDTDNGPIDIAVAVTQRDIAITVQGYKQQVFVPMAGDSIDQLIMLLQQAKRCTRLANNDNGEKD